MTSVVVDTFSYADPSDPWFKRLVIRAVERATGQPYLRWVYEDNRDHPRQGETFWDAAVRRLELHLTYNKEMLQSWPKTGPLVVIANHPFGVLDGLVISHLVSTVRSDFRVLTNAVLLRAEEARPWLFPVDFAETEEALQTNLKSRAESKKHLQNGGCLVVFPAGGVSTTPKPWDKTATDNEWGTLTARLISQAKAPVAPVYFAGQNSRLFQIASHVSATLRLSLLFKEVHDRIGTNIVMRLGEVIPYERLATINDRAAFMNHLRDATYALGQHAPKATKETREEATAQSAGNALLSDSHRPRVGLFVTCLVDLVRPQVGFAAIKLLERAGCEVIVPRSQTCCGQPAWNSGADKHAADIARQVVQAFENFDYVVVPSGSCAGMLKKHYPEALKNDPAFAARATALAAKTHELMQFLVDVRGLGDLDVNFDGSLCYHDSCSSLREMGVKAQPRKLLHSLSGAEICELKEPEVCCGFGGLFAVKYPDISERMADDKIADAVASGAKTLTGADLGCLLHLAGRMKRRGIEMDVRHAAEILVGERSPPLGKTEKP